MKRLPIIFILTLLLSSCAIEKLTELLSDGREIKSPEWDLDYELPILKKQIKMSEFVDVEGFMKDLQFRDEESIDDTKTGLIYMKLDPITLRSDDLHMDPKVKELLGNKDPLTWPLPIQLYRTPEVIENSFPSIKMDLDADDIEDLSLEYLKSSDGYLKIKAKIYIIDSTTTDDGREAQKDEYYVDGLPCFAISKMIISDTDFEFDEAEYDEKENCLVFTPKGFLSDENSKLSPILKDPTDPTCNDYVFKFELPSDALAVRGKGFSLIENIMKENNLTGRAKPNKTATRSVSRSRATHSYDEIRDLLAQHGGGQKGLEAVITEENISVKEIADACQESGKGINDLLNDIGDIGISDVLGSDIISENIDDLTDLVKDYDLGDGKTLGDVADNGDLQELSEFCSFHNEHNIKGLKIVFSVEIDLGDSFVIVGKFIHDFRAISLNEDNNNAITLPLSDIKEILKEVKVGAKINNTFSFPVDIKNARLKDVSGNEMSVMFNGKEGYYRLKENSSETCEIMFPKPISEMTDSDLMLDIIIPGDSSCAVSVSTDFMIDMDIIAAGNADVKTNMFQ